MRAGSAFAQHLGGCPRKLTCFTSEATSLAAHEGGENTQRDRQANKPMSGIRQVQQRQMHGIFLPVDILPDICMTNRFAPLPTKQIIRNPVFTADRLHHHAAAVEGEVEISGRQCLAAFILQRYFLPARRAFVQYLSHPMQGTGVALIIKAQAGTQLARVFVNTQASALIALLIIRDRTAVHGDAIYTINVRGNLPAQSEDCRG